MEKEIIINSSDEAATYMTGIRGWVDRHGRYFGNDERSARWSGCTHIHCEECGWIISKGHMLCPTCRDKKEAQKYAEAERKQWDGVTPLYSETLDRCIWDGDELDDYLEEGSDLRLWICNPIMLHQIDEEVWCDELAEDESLPDDVAFALDALNEVIKKQKPVSWVPGRFVAIIAGFSPRLPTGGDG